MGFLAFLLLGLIAGAIAKLMLPGKQGGGLYSNFARLKYEVKLLDLELKRRDGKLVAR